MEKIQDLLSFVFSLHMAIDKAKADGKVDASDLGLLIDPMMKLPDAISGAGEAYEELKNFSDHEKGVLLAWAKKSYDLDDDVLESKVEAGLDLAFSLVSFIGVLRREPLGEVDADPAE